MCQDFVTVSDAIVAVILVEASMQSSALMGITSSLHSSFPENPEEEQRCIGIYNLI